MNEFMGDAALESLRVDHNDGRTGPWLWATQLGASPQYASTVSRFTTYTFSRELWIGRSSLASICSTSRSNRVSVPAQT